MNGAEAFAALAPFKVDIFGFEKPHTRVAVSTYLLVLDRDSDIVTLCAAAAHNAMMFVRVELRRRRR